MKILKLLKIMKIHKNNNTAPFKHGTNQLLKQSVTKNIKITKTLFAEPTSAPRKIHKTINHQNMLVTRYLGYSVTYRPPVLSFYKR